MQDGPSSPSDEPGDEDKPLDEVPPETGSGVDDGASEPDGEPADGSILVDRYFLPDRNFMLLEASYAPLFAGHEAYLHRHDLHVPPADVMPSVRRALQGMTLWAAFLPNGTTAAWSLLLPEREWRLFLAAAGGEERCVVRWSPFEHEHRGHDTLFDCQTQRPRQLVQRSVFEPSTSRFDPLIQEFFRQSQQTEGRLFWDETGESAQMLIALADWEEDWYARLKDLPAGQLVAQAEFGDKHRLGQPQRWRYGCGCDPERLRQAILAASGEDVTAVFGNDLLVDVECPRCGREHTLRRP